MSSLKIGLIGGSGLGAAVAASTAGARHHVETPFGPTSDAIIETDWSGLPIYFLSRHGPGHLLNPSQINYRANIFALKQLGCTHILASGAVGSLRDEIRPRDLVVLDQVIDKTHRRAGTFFDRAAVHVEYSEPFCPLLRQTIMLAASDVSESSSKAEFTVHPRGTYVCMEGPAFSTRAESLMHRLWGGDVIGMTAMPEAKLAREAEISYAMIALATDFDSWKPHTSEQAADPFKLLNEIIGHLNEATSNAIALMKRTVALIAADPTKIADCPAHHALRLGIWSDKNRIDPEEKQRLAPLWMKYLV
jgi:5'-methylthioadenosine phosphorylase